MDVILWSGIKGDTLTGNNIISRYIGPYKLKHWIKKSGYSSQVIDHIVNLDSNQLYTATKKFITDKTLVIGLSTTFITGKLYTWSDGSSNLFPEHILKTAYRLKEEYPYIKFVLGGYGSEHVYGGPVWDATIMSYKESSEDIFVEYLNFISKNSEPPLVKVIDNYFRITEGYKLQNTVFYRPHYYEARNKIYNIEHDDFRFTKEDAILHGEPLPLDISRGCIFACRFCQYPHLGKSKTDYIRGMEYIREELIQNFELFGTTSYMVLDDTFNETQEKMDAFLKMTESLPFKINYSAYLRVDLINRFPDTAYMLKESGVFGAFHGIESMHPYASKLVGKGWNGTPQAREFIPELYHNIWKREVPMHLNYILGFPKETHDDVMGVLHWFKDAKLYSIDYVRLALSDPTASHMFSTTSEFERNSIKYGFKFLDPTKQALRTSWSNETWTPSLLTHSTKKVNKFIDDNKLRGISIWSLGARMFLGYPKELILDKTKTGVDLTEYKNNLTNVYTRYYNLLMSL
jgi:hypothetical protein